MFAGGIQERTERILWWLSEIADQRPTEISDLLETWWSGDIERGNRLLDWFGFTRGKASDEKLIDLYCRLIRSSTARLFNSRPSTRPDILLSAWTGAKSAGVSRVLNAYFDSWFEQHPNAHPFDRTELQDIDAGSLDDFAKKDPKAFLDGTIGAFARSIDIILDKEQSGQHEYSFKHRNQTGHHFGSDAFLNAFRTALCAIARSTPTQAEVFLRKLAPRKHEVFTHIWLEAIASNGEALGHMLLDLLDSSHLFNAGWQGAEWKSLADAVRGAAPSLAPQHLTQLYLRIGRHNPEHLRAIKILQSLRVEGEQQPWRTRSTAAYLLNQSGHELWCVLETIGEGLLDTTLTDRLQQLRRKFKERSIPKPLSNEAHWVQSPIARDRAVRMTDKQWLQAIERYNDDSERYRSGTFVEGGPTQLAGELQHLAKTQPTRSVALLEKIPATAHRSYISQLLRGLCEAADIDDLDLERAIRNSHDRPQHPYGKEIASLIQKHPHVACDPAIFSILAWYVEYGEVNPEETVSRSSPDKEVATIADLTNCADRQHVKGLNEVRGSAAEALGAVIWHAPEMAPPCWELLERRPNEEAAVSVRCCLMRPTIPLFNVDKRRCADLTDRLSKASSALTPTKGERLWLLLAFPSARIPRPLAYASVYVAQQIERILRRHSGRPAGNERTEAWLLLSTW